MKNNEESLLKIIKKLHVSEKTNFAEIFRKYVFQVHSDANKLDIKKSIELLFKVKVIAVHICNMKGKPKALGRLNQGYRKNWKKAYVTLGEGQKIDFGAVTA